MDDLGIGYAISLSGSPWAGWDNFASSADALFMLGTTGGIAATEKKAQALADARVELSRLPDRERRAPLFRVSQGKTPL